MPYRVLKSCAGRMTPLATSIVLALTCIISTTSSLPAHAWPHPLKKAKHALEKAGSKPKTTAAKPGKATNPKPIAQDAKAAVSSKPKAISEHVKAQAKPAKADDKTDKAAIASASPATAVAAMAIEDGSATQMAKQAVAARQYYFRNAFIARPASQPLPAEQVVTVMRYIQGHNKKLTLQEAQIYSEAIVYFSQFYQVNPKLVTGMIAIESSFRTDAISSSGAIGLGQLKPDTATWLSVSDPFDPIENIGGMTRYISWLIRKYNGSYDHAVSAYYQGPGTVDRNGITEACIPYLYKVNNALAKF